MSLEEATLWAEETLLCGLRKMPFVGPAVEITQGVAKRRAAIEIDSRVSAMEAELSRFQIRVRDLVEETITEAMETFSRPQIDGATLTRLINEFRDLNDHDYHPALFDGLFKHSTHYAELKERPEHYGTLLDDRAEFPPGMFPIFLDVDKTRLLAVPPASLSLILSTSTNNQSRIVAPGDVWALPSDEVVEQVSEATLPEPAEPERRIYPVGGTIALPPVENIHGWPADKVKALQKQTAEALELSVVVRDTLADGRPGPAMVVIPAGTYVMGSPEDEPERYSDEDQRTVTIKQPFLLGETAVTFAEYDRFCDAEGVQERGWLKNLFSNNTRPQKPNDRGWGRGDRPVINVSWHDANAYCQWLSEQTGEYYHLPSEEQWEYACRAGTTGPFWFGDQITTDQVNYNGDRPYADGSKGEVRGQTVPVKALPANSWGLYQMHGNVWEWCEDERGEYRVLRGGSWFRYGWNARSAQRNAHHPGFRDVDYGFRLARGQTSK